jgi:putative DNA primase/helicase
MTDNVVDLELDRVPNLTEVDIADCFARRHRDELRFVAEWGHWMMWDGTCWQREKTLKAFDLTRQLCKELARETNNKNEIKRVLSSKTIAAVIQIARADRRIAAVIDQWDADKLMLNTPAGVVDLRSGNLRPHRAEDYVTRAAAVGPAGDCPLWHRFLDEFTNHDRELQAYLKRACGYCLTGLTNEEALFFLYGTGGNGKGVFVHTVAGVMGDYHRTAPMDVFIASNVERHPTELAMLQGARLVTATETEEGKRWDEPRIKALTGSDPISARFMRQDFFEYLPQFKLVISGNHRPGLRSVDEAIRRRLNNINCAAVIPEARRDPYLTEKLKQEWSGVLRWMIDGCIEWQRDRLKPPSAVVTATNDYLESEDAFGSWLEECCLIDVNGKATLKELWDKWQEWAVNNHEFVGTKGRFQLRLEDRGFRRDRFTDESGKKHRVHRGLTVPL